MAKKKANKKTSKATRSSYIAKAPIRRLMKQEGAELVAEAAVQILIDKLTDVAKDVTKKAVKFVKDDKRKRITGADIIAVQRSL